MPLARLLVCKTFALCLLALSCQAQRATTAKVSAADEAQFEKAMRLSDQGQPAQARPILEELNRRYPSKFEIAESLGLLDAGDGDLQAALPLFKTGVRVAPTDATAHANLGTAYLKLGNVDGAVSELSRAATLHASDGPTQNALGQALMLAKNPCKAADAFAAARPSEPGDADLGYNLGLALFECGRLDDAETALTATPGADQTAAVQSLLADVEERNKHFKQAAEHYLRANQLDPSESNLYALGLDLLRHWSFEAAITTFEAGEQHFPGSKRILVGLGIAYYGAARYSDAIRIFSGLLAAEPNNELYGEIFGRSCTVLTDTHEAPCLRLTALAQQAKANANLSLYAAVAILHQPADSQQLETAQELLNNAIRANPNSASAHYEEGVLMQQQGRWAESVGALQQALTLDPKLARAHYRLGLAYRRTGRKDDAQREMAVDREEDQEQRNDLNARMQQITTLLVSMQ